MAYLAAVIFLGMLIWLLRSHTKITLVILGSLAAIVAVIAIIIEGPNEYSRWRNEQESQLLNLSGQISHELCGSDRPFRIRIENNSSFDLLEISLRAQGYNQEFSKPLLDTGWRGISSDRIVPAGQFKEQCFEIPKPATSSDRPVSTFEKHLLEKAIELAKAEGKTQDLEFLEAELNKIRVEVWLFSGVKAHFAGL